MYPHLSYLMNRMLYIKVTWPLKQVVNDEGLITDIHRMPHRKLLCIIIGIPKNQFTLYHVLSEKLIAELNQPIITGYQF